jgi:hypothetical protein
MVLVRYQPDANGNTVVCGALCIAPGNQSSSRSSSQARVHLHNVAATGNSVSVSQTPGLATCSAVHQGSKGLGVAKQSRAGCCCRQGKRYPAPAPALSLTTCRSQVALSPGVVNQQGTVWSATPLLARGGAIAVVIAQTMVDYANVTLQDVCLTGNTAGGAWWWPLLSAETLRWVAGVGCALELDSCLGFHSGCAHTP